MRGGATNDNVVTLPGRSAADSSQKSIEAAPTTERWKGIADAGTALAGGLDAIAREDKDFDPKHFIAGARAAYEMIVLAYAEGDRRTLKNLLSRDVYDGFEAAIKERESKGETVESRFVAIDKSDITGAELRGRMERSPLMDAALFARDMEKAYRRMWRQFCDGATPTG